MPHIGQVPGPICRTSGCIGHVYSPAAGAGAVALPLPEGARNARGSSRKRRAQPSAQKWYVRPPWSTAAAASSAAIVMPQTGSVTIVRAFGSDVPVVIAIA